jgi:hypothetical protein
MSIMVGDITAISMSMASMDITVIDIITKVVSSSILTVLTIHCTSRIRSITDIIWAVKQ